MIQVKKSQSRRCRELGLYMHRLIALAGERQIDFDDWASFCFVKVVTLKKWINGYAPSEDLLYRIAKYIAPRAGLLIDDVFQKIRSILSKWRLR